MSTINFWPTPQDYNEAVQNPHACFADPDLKNGRIETNMLGLPRSMTGAFASVYKIVNDDKCWAVRCFLTSRLDQKDRYKHISDFVLFDTLECTIDFHYVEQGVQVKGAWYPCLKMPWVEGQTLDQYVNAHYSDSAAMKRLLEDFHKLVDEMECAGIGHGDLQHGNIIVTPEGLRLVDYDALFVPALLGRTSLELGHPNYQHPDRNEYFYDPDVDNFSCWLISKSLLMIAIDPTLYEKHLGGDDCLLFKRTDLARPEDSQLFKILMEHSSEVIRDSAQLIMRMLWAAPTAIPILDCPEEMLQLLPTIRNENRLETVEPVQPSLTLTSAPSAPNRFDFIDDEAVIVAKSNRKKNRKTATQQLAQLNQRRQKVAEDIHLFFSPYTWTRQHLKVALSQFDKGNYDGALNTYLRVYKVLEKHDWKKDDNFFSCLMGLGYCSALSDRIPLAGNYFLLASKTANTQTRALRAALCLAAIRYETGDVTGAHKLIKDLWKPGAEFGKAIEAELRNLFLQRTSTFEMLASLGIEMQKAKESRWSDVLVCAKLVLDQSSNRTTIEMTPQHSEAMLGLAGLYLKNSDFGQALALFQEVGRNAITSGIKGVGSQAVFSACCLQTNRMTGSSIKRSERLVYNHADWGSFQQNHLKNLNYLADCIESSVDISSILSSPIVSTTSGVVPKECVREVVIELADLLKKRKRLDAALNCYSVALRLSVDYGIDLERELFDSLSSFSDEQIWNILSETFFSPDKLNAHILLEFLIAQRDARLLTVIAGCLRDEEKLLPLSLVFTTVAIQAPHQFLTLFAKLEAEQNAADETMTPLTVQALLHAADCLDRELTQEIQKNKSGATTEGIIRNLDAINSIREYLEDTGPVAMMMMRDEIAPHLLEWMRKQDVHQLSNFVRTFVEYSSIDDLKTFILNLASSDDFSDLEAVVRSLRTWGMEPETLIALLLPAAEESAEKLVAILDTCILENDGRLSGNLKEAAKHLRALLCIRTIAIETQIGKQFEILLRTSYTPARVPKLALLLLEPELKNDSRLLSEVTLAMLEFDAGTLMLVLRRMAACLPPELIIPIFTKLLASGKSPIVIPLVQELATKPELSETLRLLTIQLVRVLSDDELTALARPIMELDNPDSAAVVLQSLKAFSKTNVIHRLIDNCGLSVLNTSQMFPSKETITSIVRTGDIRSGAALIHIAAMSSDKELVKVLAEFAAAGTTASARTALLTETVALCDRALGTYRDTIENKPGLETNLSTLATLNIAALKRLALFQNGSGVRSAIETLNKQEYVSFARTWLLELAQKNDLERIVQICCDAVQENNMELLESFLLNVAATRNLRPLISVAKSISACGFARHLVPLCKSLLKTDLQDAFGAVALEIVTSDSANRDIILELLKMTNDRNSEAFRILLRQIGFYRGQKELKSIGRIWAETEGNDAVLYHSQALGLIT